MDDLKFDSNEWKEKLKGKSPEEIAEIVGNYYEEKYNQDRIFSPKKIIGIVLFTLFIIFIFIIFFIFFRLFSQLSL